MKQEEHSGEGRGHLPPAAYRLAGSAFLARRIPAGEHQGEKDREGQNQANVLEDGPRVLLHELGCLGPISAENGPGDHFLVSRNAEKLTQERMKPKEQKERNYGGEYPGLSGFGFAAIPRGPGRHRQYRKSAQRRDFARQFPIDPTQPKVNRRDRDESQRSDQ